MKISVKLLPALAVLSACATVPTGPSVAVLPGANKNFEQFRDDGVVCQHYANEQVGQTAGQAASDSAAKSAAVSTALGAAAGALFGAATGHPGAGAAIGAGGGLLVGGAYWKRDVRQVCVHGTGPLRYRLHAVHVYEGPPSPDAVGIPQLYAGLPGPATSTTGRLYATTSSAGSATAAASGCAALAVMFTE